MFQAHPKAGSQCPRVPSRRIKTPSRTLLIALLIPWAAARLSAQATTRPFKEASAVIGGELLDWQPEVLVAACCGYTADRTRADLALLCSRPEVAELPCIRNGRVYVADGVSLFSRPGPSLVTSLEVLAEMVAAGAPAGSEVFSK